MKSFSKIIKSKIYSLIILSLFLCIGIQTQAKKVVVKKKHKTTLVKSKRGVVARKPVLRVIPRGAVAVRHRGLGYHMHRGLFYRSVAGGYVVVRPPFGYRMRTLPIGYRTIVIGRRSFFYFGGVYYIKSNNEYEVIEAPENSVVNQMPGNYKKVSIDDKVYYLQDGVYYEKFTSDNGDEQFYNIGTTLENIHN